MTMVALVHFNSIGIPEFGIEFRYLAKCFVCAFDREKIESGSCHKHRPRIHHQQEPGVIDSV